MSHTRPLLLLIVLSLFSAQPYARDLNEPDPLFASEEILDVTITAPLKTIMLDRPTEKYVSGTFVYRESDGRLMEFDIGLRTRGNFRRREDTCEFAPLRVNFKKSEIENTLFDKQDKLKLVTHCNGGSERYQQTVVSEYLAYRMLNILTDISYRARLLRITYVNTEKNNDSEVAYGIFVEHKERMAKRIGHADAQVRMIAVPDLVPEYAALGAMFQYFLGNTDYSQIATAPGQNCCHNSDLFKREDGKYFSVPYDFDMTGFVYAPHARPNPRFGLRHVRQRLYRGRCLHNEYVENTVALFFDRRDAIVALIEEQPQLTKSIRRSLLRFVDMFYDSVERPKDRRNNIIDECIRQRD